MDLYAKLAGLGLKLPPAPPPVAVYVPAVRSGSLIVVSGQLPTDQGQLIAKGIVPTAVSVEQAHAGARQCALNGLAQIDRVLNGDWTRFSRVVRVGVFVAAEPSFTDHSKISDGASQLLGQLFDEAGKHARTTIGVCSLPLGASVEVELLVEVK